MDRLVSARYAAQIGNDTGRITHIGLAKLWLQIYGQNFKYSKNKWYKYEHDKWLEIHQDAYLIIMIRSTLAHDCSKWIATIANCITATSDKKYVAKQINFVAHLYSMLDSDTFINNIVKECRDLAYENEAHHFCNDLMSKL